jgi:DNA-binding YbaB/EbfC family protein
MDLKKLMQQAQEMQKKMQSAQEEIARLEITGESGGGAVKIIFNGQHKAKSCKISPDVCPLPKDDLEILEDLIVAAINAGGQKIEEVSKQKLSSLTSGLDLPEGFAG